MGKDGIVKRFSTSGWQTHRRRTGRAAIAGHPAPTANAASAVTAAPPSAAAMLPALEELHGVAHHAQRGDAGHAALYVPESWQSAPATPQSDVYSLPGAIFPRCAADVRRIWRTPRSPSGGGSSSRCALATVAPGTSPGLAAPSSTAACAVTQRSALPPVRSSMPGPGAAPGR